MHYDTEEHNVNIELRMRLLRYSGAQSSSYSSSYSVGTVLTKPCTFELRMRLLQYATVDATITQDRENQNGRKYSRNIK